MINREFLIKMMAFGGGGQDGTIYGQRVRGHLNITPIGVSSPNCDRAVGSMQSRTMFLYAVALQLPFSETYRRRHVPA